MTTSLCVCPLYVLLCCCTEAGGDHSGESFRDGGDREGYGDFEIINGPTEHRAVVRISEMTNVDQPHNHTNHTNHLHTTTTQQHNISERLLKSSRWRG